MFEAFGFTMVPRAPAFKDPKGVPHTLNEITQSFANTLRSPVASGRRALLSIERGEDELAHQHLSVAHRIADAKDSDNSPHTQRVRSGACTVEFGERS